MMWHKTVATKARLGSRLEEYGSLVWMKSFREDEEARGKGEEEREGKRKEEEEEWKSVERKASNI
jgi:hypothetical protein